MMRGSDTDDTVLLNPAEPRLAAVIRPNVFTLRFVVGFGSRVLLVMLNASARNSNRFASPKLNVLESAVSNVHHPGPWILGPPIFPSVPVAGRTNAAGFR